MSNSDHQQKSGTVTRRGLLLKEAREVRGLSVETIHEMTKIPLDVLHAIEEGYTVRMVSAYYFKGFIKMYAKFLNLDPALVLDEPIPEPQAVEAPDRNVPDPQHTKFNEYLVRQNKKQTVINGIILSVSFLLIVSIVGCWATHPKSKQGTADGPDKKEQTGRKLLESQSADRRIVERTKPRIKPEGVPVRVAAVPETAPPDVLEEPRHEKIRKPAGHRVTLTVKSHSTGWLQVKVDGDLVFQSTMRTGTTESWEGQKSIELSGKNVNNLEFEVNGKMIGMLGKSDRGARRVMITSDGLAVKK